MIYCSLEMKATTLLKAVFKFLSTAAELKISTFEYNFAVDCLLFF